eukprot:gene22795-31091_t
MIVGKVQGHGFGNSLVPFPAAYYFAVFTGRNVLIYDYSALGYSCQYLKCGFLHSSQIVEKYPNFSSLIQGATDLTFVDYKNHLSGKINITAKFVADYSVTPKSDWWAWYPDARDCVSRLTGCPVGDVMCSERYALQSLIPGPFQKKFSAEENKRIEGLHEHFKHFLHSLPRNKLPRYDVGIHLRSQLHAFESLASNRTKRDMDLQVETNHLLNSTIVPAVLRVVTEKVHHLMKGRPSKLESFNIFIAADNDNMKFLMSRLLTESLKGENITVNYLQTNGIVHVKNMYKNYNFTSDSGLFDLLLDWYFLSLSKTLLAWRKGNSLSSFAYSAQRISGNMSRSDANLQNGLGTTGYLINNDRKGRIKFDPFWYYPTQIEI